MLDIVNIFIFFIGVLADENDLGYIRKTSKPRMGFNFNVWLDQEKGKEKERDGIKKERKRQVEYVSNQTLIASCCLHFNYSTHSLTHPLTDTPFIFSGYYRVFGSVLIF